MLIDYRKYMWIHSLGSCGTCNSEYHCMASCGTGPDEFLWLKLSCD